MVNPGAFQGSRKEFLTSEKPYYKSAVEDGFAGEAIANIQRRYFKRFPIDLPHDEEPSAEHLAAVDDEVADPDPIETIAAEIATEQDEAVRGRLWQRRWMVDFRRAQIKRWMTYQFMKDNNLDPKDSGAQNPYAALLYKLTGKEPHRPRQKTPVNIWRKTQRAIIENKVKLRAAAEGIDAKGLAALRDKIARDMYARLSEEEKREWVQQSKMEHERAMAAWQEDKDGATSTKASDRQRCIQNLVRFLQPILDMTCEATGWKATLLIGGPEPAHQGRLNIVSVNAGMTSGDLQMNFGTLERGHIKKYILPIFGSFLQKCYSPEECRRRALSEEEATMPLEEMYLAEEGGECYDVEDVLASSSLTQDPVKTVGFTEHGEGRVPRPRGARESHAHTIPPSEASVDSTGTQQAKANAQKAPLKIKTRISRPSSCASTAATTPGLWEGDDDNDIDEPLTPFPSSNDDETESNAHGRQTEKAASIPKPSPPPSPIRRISPPAEEYMSASPAASCLEESSDSDRSRDAMPLPSTAIDMRDSSAPESSSESKESDQPGCITTPTKAATRPTKHPTPQTPLVPRVEVYSPAVLKRKRRVSNSEDESESTRDRTGSGSEEEEDELEESLDPSEEEETSHSNAEGLADNESSDEGTPLAKRRRVSDPAPSRVLRKDRVSSSLSGQTKRVSAPVSRERRGKVDATPSSSKAKHPSTKAPPPQSTASKSSLEGPLTVPDKAPHWVIDAIAMLSAARFGEDWKMLLRRWLKFEKKYGYKDCKIKLKPNLRPEAIGMWVKRHRSRTWRPVFNLQKFYTQFEQWYLACQPRWRIDNNGNIKLKEIEGGDWSSFKISGINGLYSILVGLFYTGLALDRVDGMGSEDAGDHDEIRAGWRKYVRDLNRVFNHCNSSN